MPIVKSAILEHGYCAIDTAKVYGNEQAIGKALKECLEQGGVTREQLYVTSKLWHTDKAHVEQACRKQIEDLQVGYLDLYLVHWMVPDLDWTDQDEPVKSTPVHKVWAQMERLVDLGLVKNIGVSNCTIPTLLDIWALARIKPVINQVECHPYNVLKEFEAFHRKLGVKLEAYSPMGAPGFTQKEPELMALNLFQEKVITELAGKYGKTSAQIILNWHLHLGHIIIPKTTKKERLEENIKVYGFKLSEKDYDRISALDRGVRFFNPKFFTEEGNPMAGMPYFD